MPDQLLATTPAWGATNAPRAVVAVDELAATGTYRAARGDVVALGTATTAEAAEPAPPVAACSRVGPRGS